MQCILSCVCVCVCAGAGVCVCVSKIIQVQMMDLLFLSWGDTIYLNEIVDHRTQSLLFCICDMQFHSKDFDWNNNGKKLVSDHFTSSTHRHSQSLTHTQTWVSESKRPGQHLDLFIDVHSFEPERQLMQMAEDTHQYVCYVTKAYSSPSLRCFPLSYISILLLYCSGFQKVCMCVCVCMCVHMYVFVCIFVNQSTCCPTTWKSLRTNKSVPWPSR